MAQVFISYSRKNLSFAKKLASDLVDSGLDVWYDLSGLDGGARWRIEIEKAIQESQFVIVVLSPDAVVSDWVEREYLFASNLGKKIIPLLYKDCDLPIYYLNLQLIDVQGNKYKRRYDEILRSLRVTSIPTDGEEKPPKRKQYPHLMLWVLGGVIMLLGLIGFLLGNPPGTNDPTHTPTSAPPTSTFTLQPTRTPSPTLTATISPTSTQIPSETPVPLLAPIAGTWIGVDKGTVGGNPVADRDVEMTIKADCNIGDDCGTRVVQVNGSQCRGSLILVDVQDNAFTFDTVSSEDSASFCGGGGTIIIRSMLDGTLSSESDGYNDSGARVIKTGTYTHP